PTTASFIVTLIKGITKILFCYTQMKNYGFIFLILFQLEAFPQTNDSFSDGNFTINPAWSGSASRFVVNDAQQLQLNYIRSETSYLSTPFSASSLDDIEWRVYARLPFSPSGSNFARIYLVSDNADLTASLNGYYLQLGESGSSDAIELFRQNGTSAI